MKVLASNKKAFIDYQSLDKYEAGIVLHGWEVKSIRSGAANLRDSFVKFSNGELWALNINIPKWKTQSRLEVVNTMRERKLLLNKSEINKIEKQLHNKGLTLVPTQLYLSNNNRIKVEIHLMKGLKKFDKRQKIKEKELKKDIRSEAKGDYRF